MDLIPTETREEMIALNKLTLLPDLQLRYARNPSGLAVREEAVQDYEALLADNVDMGALEVIEEVDKDANPTGRLLLADGFHRYEAHRRLRHDRVVCRIRRGSIATGIMLTARLNGGRGLPLSRADRRRAAEQLLKALADEGVTWTDGQIGRWAGIHRTTVAQVRAELSHDYDLPTARPVMRGDQLYTMQPPIKPVLDDELNGPEARMIVERPNSTRRRPGGNVYREETPPAAPPAAPPPVVEAVLPPPGKPGSLESQVTFRWPHTPIPEAELIPGKAVFEVSWSRVLPDGSIDAGWVDNETFATHLPEEVWQHMKRARGE